MAHGVSAHHRRMARAKAAIMTVTVSGFSAITWAAHARLGSLLLKQ